MAGMAQCSQLFPHAYTALLEGGKIPCQLVHPRLQSNVQLLLQSRQATHLDEQGNEADQRGQQQADHTAHHQQQPGLIHLSESRQFCPLVLGHHLLEGGRRHRREAGGHARLLEFEIHHPDVTITTNKTLHVRNNS